MESPCQDNHTAYGNGGGGDSDSGHPDELTAGRDATAVPTTAWGGYAMSTVNVLRQVVLSHSKGENDGAGRGRASRSDRKSVV